jgi:uncharacterized protein involved in exopolysaccharide biosynthesis
MNRNKPLETKPTETLGDVIALIFAAKGFILRICVLFVAIGVVFALSYPKSYKSSLTLLPESSRQGSSLAGILSPISSLAGVNLNEFDDQDGIRTDIYPYIIDSYPFLIHLMNQEFEFESLGESLSLFDYFDRHGKMHLGQILYKYTLGLPSALRHSDSDSSLYAIKSDSLILFLSKKEYTIAAEIRSRLDLDLDKRTGIITISAEFPEPEVSAEVAHRSIAYITDYVTNYRIEKERRTLKFIEERYREARRKYVDAQLELARFRDQNQNVVSLRVKSEEERLAAEFNLAFNLFNGLAQQLEQSRIKVQERTPVFSVLNPANVPIDKNKPQRKIMVIGALLLGLVFSIFWVITRAFIQQHFTQANRQEA